MKFLDYIKNNKIVSIALGLSLLLNIVWLGVINEDIKIEEEMQMQIEKLEQDTESKENRIEELAKENMALEEKVEQAKPWFEMKEEERKAEQERLEQERLAKEEEERKEQERLEQERIAKEKQGYNTGITYSQLARTPDEYEGEKVKFSGKVLQISEGLFSDVIRLGVNGSYDNVIWLTVPSGITEKRILEDDYITIYGISKGIHTYTTVMGASMSIPSVSVDKIDM